MTKATDHLSLRTCYIFNNKYVVREVVSKTTRNKCLDKTENMQNKLRRGNFVRRGYLQYFVSYLLSWSSYTRKYKNSGKTTFEEISKFKIVKKLFAFLTSYRSLWRHTCPSRGGGAGQAGLRPARPSRSGTTAPGPAPAARTSVSRLYQVNQSLPLSTLLIITRSLKMAIAVRLLIEIIPKAENVFVDQIKLASAGYTLNGINQTQFVCTCM